MMVPISKSYFHRGGQHPLLGLTIPERFTAVVEQFAQREAVVGIPQGRRLSYGQLAQQVDQVARGLMALGFGRGDRIGIWSTNNVEWLMLQMATARIGVILVNINPAYRSRELHYALQRSELQGLFLIPRFRSSDYVAILLELMPELKATTSGRVFKEFPQLRHVVIYDSSSARATKRPTAGFTVWQEMLSAGDSISADDLEAVSGSLDRDDAINIQYTSGTTGFPKAVVLTHHNIVNNAYFAAKAMHFDEHDRLAVPVPFYHCFGMVLANLLCLAVGACVVIPCEHFDPLAVLEAIDEEACTAVHGVPTMFIAELDHPQFMEFNLTTLRTGIMAGAPCPAPLMKRVMQEMHCGEILIGYGETEASPLTHLTLRDDSLARRIGTVGRNLPHQEVKIVDITTRETVPLGEVGEVCFRGYHVMQGYYGDPEATAHAIDDNGWLASGDLGTMDAEGYLRITGRRKEMIIRGGENIYPKEIEDVIFAHPKVAEVAVFGVPHPLYGEEVMAWVQLRAGEQASEQEVLDFCRDRLAHFKIPKYLWFVTEFPMTVTGKLQKYRMRELAMDQLQATDHSHQREARS